MFYSMHMNRLFRALYTQEVDLKEVDARFLQQGDPTSFAPCAATNKALWVQNERAELRDQLRQVRSRLRTLIGSGVQFASAQQILESRKRSRTLKEMRPHDPCVNYAEDFCIEALLATARTGVMIDVLLDKPQERSQKKSDNNADTLWAIDAMRDLPVDENPICLIARRLIGR